jgi:hypothetical protein
MGDIMIEALIIAVGVLAFILASHQYRLRRIERQLSKNDEILP